MKIKIKAVRTDGLQVLLVFDPKIHDFSFIQIGENVTQIRYNSNGCTGEIEVRTHTIEQG